MTVCATPPAPIPILRGSGDGGSVKPVVTLSAAPPGSALPSARALKDAALSASVLGDAGFVTGDLTTAPNVPGMLPTTRKMYCLSPLASWCGPALETSGPTPKPLIVASVEAA